MAKLKNGFDKLTNDQLISKAEFIQTQLANNAVFADLDPTTGTLKAQNEEFRNAISAATTGDKTAMARRDALRMKLIDLLRLMATAVMAIAQGDREKLVSSGFDLEKTRESRLPLIKPAAPKLMGTGNSGQIKVVAKRQAAMISMIHQITEHPFTAGSSWTSFTSSSTKHVFENCTPGKTYLIRVCIVGSRNQCMESEALSYIAQ